MTDLHITSDIHAYVDVMVRGDNVHLHVSPTRGSSNDWEIGTFNKVAISLDTPISDNPMFAMHEGFNTELFKRGSVFYLCFTNNTYQDPAHRTHNPHSKPIEREFKGNVFIAGSSTDTLSVRTTSDLLDGTVLNLQYASIKSGDIEILEMRELK